MTDMALESLVRQLAPQAEVVMVPDGQPAASVLLAVVARADGDVVRLYSGDPWLHPAHVVELTALNRAGIGSKPVAGVSTEVAVPALAGIAVHVRHLAVACTIGPIEAVPSVLDPARTLVVLTDDARSVAIRLGAGGDSDIPAALVPLDRPAAVLRGNLTEIDARAPVGRCLLVVGAVAGSAGPPRAAAADLVGRSIGAVPPELGRLQPAAAAGERPANAAADLAGHGAVPTESIGDGVGSAEVVADAAAPRPDGTAHAGRSKYGPHREAPNSRSSEPGARGLGTLGVSG